MSVPTKVLSSGEMELSVFILTWGRLELLKQCLSSIELALPRGSEVLVLVNGEDAATEAWLKAWAKPWLKSFLEPPRCRANARNRAFELAQSDIIYFLDDDVVVPEHLFVETLRRFQNDPELTVLGGPNLTLPEAPLAERLLGSIFTSPFAAPLVRKRYTPAGECEDRAAQDTDLILCNLAFRAQHLRGVRFPTKISSSEENLVISRCLALGRRVVYSPRLFVYHRRRATVRGLAQQVFQYGMGRAQQMILRPQSNLWPFWLYPLAWLGGIAFMALGGVPGLVAAGVYALVAILAGMSSMEMRRLPKACWLCIAPLTGLVHLCYGLGVWWGLARRGRASW